MGFFEFLTKAELKRAGFDGCEGKLLSNVKGPKEGGKDSEIDWVYVCRKGIILIEGVNCNGMVFGSEEEAEWTNPRTFDIKRFPNPVKRIRSHAKWIMERFGEEGKRFPIFSLIVFPEKCTLKNIAIKDLNLHVIKLDTMSEILKEIWVCRDYFKNEDVDAICDKLLSTSSASTSGERLSGATHIEKVDSSLKKDLSYDATKCPDCGAPLTLKRGVNGTKQYYTCSNFPKCKYVKRF